VASRCTSAREWRPKPDRMRSRLSTVKDLVAGSGIRFADRVFAFSRVSGEWRLFAAESQQIA